MFAQPEHNMGLKITMLPCFERCYGYYFYFWAYPYVDLRYVLIQVEININAMMYDMHNTFAMSSTCHAKLTHSWQQL